jgi:hypothetical protein
MKFLAGVIAAILLAACSAKSTDEEQVRAVIDGVEEAAEARDASDVLEFVADDYADSSGLDKTQLQNYLRGYFLANPKVELLVSIESLAFPVDGLAQAVISVRKMELGDSGAQRLKVEFRRAGGDWRVVRADRLAP